MEEPESSETPQEFSDVYRQAVYRCFGGDGRVLYIGTTGRLGRRLAAHAEKIWFLEVCGITLEWYPDEKSATIAERRAIRIEQPKYNLVHKKGRIYPLPRIGAARGEASAPAPPVFKPFPERRADLARALDATEKPLHRQELLIASGMKPSILHVLLTALIEQGVIIRAGHGYYKRVPGRSARGTIDTGQW
jgi:hypothetical protein